MTKYFFHIRDGQGLNEDDQGVELPDVKAVYREGAQAAREMMAECVLDGGIVDGQTFEVVDESGAVVATIPFKSAIRLE